MRPSGWRRVGVVVSVVWFVGFGGYLWHDSVTQSNDSFTRFLRICDAALDMETDALKNIQDPTKRDRKFDQNMKEERDCKAQATTSFERILDEQYSGIPILLGIDLATVAMGWLLVLGVVGIVRWIRRGFAAA
jgi:hypothetical protein